MHIPDGFVSGTINTLTAGAAAGVLLVSLTRLRRKAEDRTFAVPLVATVASFVFAAQMLNFPIGGGTSGHFLGAVTAAALLGPWRACLVLALVILIQALLFGDGGLTALGSNICNMGLIAGLATYPLLRGVRALLPAGRTGYALAAAVTSWFSVVLAASSCALELAFSGTSPLRLILPALAGTHAIIGLGEALITFAVLSTVATTRPDILPPWAQLCVSTPLARRSPWRLAGAGLTLALLLALLSGPLASSLPDGLKKVANDQGFLVSALPKEQQRTAVFPEYKIAAIASEPVSTGLAGVFGALVVFGAGFVLIRLTAGPPAVSRGAGGQGAA